MPTSSSASRTAAASRVSASSTAPPGNAIWPPCATRFAERREKRIDHSLSCRTSGTSTHARRYCGASISIAGRLEKICCSRSSDWSLNRDTRPRLRFDHGDALHGVHQRHSPAAQLLRKLDRRRLARRQVARQVEPATVGNEVISRLAIRSSAESDIADIANSQDVDYFPHYLEFGKQWECSGGLLPADGGLQAAAAAARHYS